MRFVVNALVFLVYAWRVRGHQARNILSTREQQFCNCSNVVTAVAHQGLCGSCGQCLAQESAIHAVRVSASLLKQLLSERILQERWWGAPGPARARLTSPKQEPMFFTKVVETKKAQSVPPFGSQQCGAVLPADDQGGPRLRWRCARAFVSLPREHVAHGVAGAW